MLIEEEYIRLIFGLKLKQIRTEKNLSLFGLSKLTNISKSYLNEIEKGKKYPKTDKIAVLAEVLEVPYDNLVSLKLDKNLAPLGEILQSNILKEIPLDVFGIQETDLIDIISNAPAKVNAFISTIIKISQNYNLSRESFYLASLRSYQEAQNNYFDDIEQAVLKFAKAYQVDLTKKIKSADLVEILVEEFEYTILDDELSKHTDLKDLRSVFVPDSKTLLLSHQLDESQKTFILAKELAYNYLDLTDRLYTFSWVKFNTFDQVLNNFFASYFAGALIIPKAALVDQLKEWFEQEEWSNEYFSSMIARFTNSPETYYQRLTNILPKEFNMKNLFFLRFNNKKQKTFYQLTKELHITQQQPPTANENHEHYCRRWVSIDILNRKNEKQGFITDAQISVYPGDRSDYFVVTSASSDMFKSDYNRSISLGILMSSHAKNKIKFLNDPQLKSKEVGVTCERCPRMDCNDRVVEPINLMKEEFNQSIEEKVADLMAKFGKKNPS